MSDTYRPSDIHVGGARLSTSMLDTWTTCRQLFFLRYLAPHPNWPAGTAGAVTPLESLGLEPYSISKDLLIGSASHVGLHCYRLASFAQGDKSGRWQDCSLDSALHFATDYINTHKHELEYEIEADEALATTQHLMREYHTEVLRNPLLQWNVARTPDGTTPALEREYEIPVAGGRFLYTVKVDALGYDTHLPHGELRPREYKTSSRSGTFGFTVAASLKGQGLGELAILYQHYPNVRFGGLQYELLVKDRGKKSEYGTIMPISCAAHPKAVVRWLDNVEAWALEISWAVRRWETAVRRGADPWTAGLDIFHQSGMANGSCIRWNRECSFAGYCRNADLGANTLLASFRPRSAATIPEDTTE